MKTQRFLLCGLPVAALALMLAAPLWAQGNRADAPPPPPPGGFGGPMGFAPRLEQLDPNQDGVVTEAEFYAAWREALDTHYNLLDANGDGVLDKEEMSKRPGPPEGGERPGRPDGMGQGRRGGPGGPNGPGGQAGPPPEGERPGRGPRPGFPTPEELDADKDGNITRDEFDLGWDKSLKEQFKRLDANADGSLVRDEMPKRPGRGQGPGGGRRGGPGMGPQE